MTGTVLRAGSPEEAGMDPVRIGRVRDWCAGLVESDDTQGLQVLVARHGVIALHEAYGTRRHDDATLRMQLDSIFPLASCTKALTAAAVMCLADDGLIGLNRPFVDYLTEWDVPDVPGVVDAKVADLLCHTAGLDELELIEAAGSDIAAGLPVAPDPGQHAMTARVIASGTGVALHHDPGSAMLYSDIGFIVLGDIVRRVSGQPFADFVRDRIFEPLGMDDSYLVLPPEVRARQRVLRAPDAPGNGSVGLSAAAGAWPGLDAELLDGWDAGCDGWMASARDLAVFCQMLLRDGTYGDQRILSRASARVMRSPQVPPGVPSMFSYRDPVTGDRVDDEFGGGGYGFGLFLFGAGPSFAINGSLASSSSFGHAGMGGAYFWVDPEADLVGVYLSVATGRRRVAPRVDSDLFMNQVHAAVVD